MKRTLSVIRDRVPIKSKKYLWLLEKESVSSRTHESNLPLANRNRNTFRNQYIFYGESYRPQITELKLANQRIQAAIIPQSEHPMTLLPAIQNLSIHVI